MRAARRDILVWDLPTRIFHWALVLLVGSNLFLVSPHGGRATLVHFVSGYSIGGLVLFRLVWGFIGSRRSRFADFIRPWPALRAYLARLIRFDPPRSVGHNPVGGWMILVLLAFLLLMIATGLCAASPRAAGPLAPLLGAGLARKAGHLHVLLSDLLIALIGLHVGGVLVEWLLVGENLVLAMLNGRKRAGPAEAPAEPAPAPIWRAAVPLALVAGLVLWLAISTDYGRTAATLAPSNAEAGAIGR